MKIAEASKSSGLSIDTLRFYEKEGLITPARSSGQRVYSANDLDELDTIARLRRLGISIPEIRSLLAIDRSIGDLTSLSPEAVTRIRDVMAILDAHSSQLKNRIGEMQTTLMAFQTMTSKLTNLLESGGLANESR
jgi:DNA-binding transcriptional MerR regulator